MTKVAIVTCNTLGDGLLYMTLAHNLQQNGYDVVVYSNMISQLSEWFPGKAILPYPNVPSASSALAEYDAVIADGMCFFN